MTDSRFAGFALDLWMALALVAPICATGCNSVSPIQSWNGPWDDNGSKKLIIPDRILAVWSDTVLHQPGEPGMRGFGGRLFFYSGEEKVSLEVDGGLIVYVFDADNMDPRSPAPERKFAFTADQFVTHMSRSELGKSYSIWIPWDEVGGPSRRLSIVTRFEGRNGGVVISQPTLKLLPGVDHSLTISRTMDPPAHANTDNSGYAAQPVSFDGVLANDRSMRNAKPKEATRRIVPQTIDLPPSFYERNLRNREIGSDTVQANEVGQPESTSGETRIAATDETVARRLEPRERSNKGSDSRTQRTYPSRTTPMFEPRNRTLRREPFRGGWIDSLPQTPRRPGTRGSDSAVENES